jgi:hypothetical protein
LLALSRLSPSPPHTFLAVLQSPSQSHGGTRFLRLSLCLYGLLLPWKPENQIL